MSFIATAESFAATMHVRVAQVRPAKMSGFGSFARVRLLPIRVTTKPENTQVRRSQWSAPHLSARAAVRLSTVGQAFGA
jgi:hypothetical protein